MRLTKHTHSTVTLEHHDQKIVIDPGAFTPDVRLLLEGVSAVLVTHEHPDHFAVDAVRDALQARPELPLWGPPAVTQALADTAAERAGLVTTVHGGETLDVTGFGVQVLGSNHASIHDGIAVPHNVGYLVDGLVLHPGDTYLLPPTTPHTLLVPVSGPWVKMGDAIDFILAVGPQQTVQIHDVMLSDIGRASTEMFLGERGLTRTPMLVLEPGQSTNLLRSAA